MPDVVKFAKVLTKAAKAYRRGRIVPELSRATKVARGREPDVLLRGMQVAKELAGQPSIGELRRKAFGLLTSASRLERAGKRGPIFRRGRAKKLGGVIDRLLGKQAFVSAVFQPPAPRKLAPVLVAKARPEIRPLVAPEALPKPARLDEAQSGKPFGGLLFRGSGRPKEEIYRTLQEPILGPGQYTTPSMEFAKSFGPKVEQVKASLQNPLVIRTDLQWRELTKEAGWEYPNPIRFSPEGQAKSKLEIEKMRLLLEQKGYDGVVIQPSHVGDEAKTLSKVFGGDTVVKFAPSRREIAAPAPVRPTLPRGESKPSGRFFFKGGARKPLPPNLLALLRAMETRGDIPKPILASEEVPSGVAETLFGSEAVGGRRFLGARQRIPPAEAPGVGAKFITEEPRRELEETLSFLGSPAESSGFMKRAIEEAQFQEAIDEAVKIYQGMGERTPTEGLRRMLRLPAEFERGTEFGSKLLQPIRAARGEAPTGELPPAGAVEGLLEKWVGPRPPAQPAVIRGARKGVAGRTSLLLDILRRIREGGL